MALIERRAGDRVPTRAAPGLAGVRARATAAVIAGRALWLHRVGAHAGRTVALANVVALIEHRADHGVPAGTLTRLAAVGSGAEAPIAAGRAVWLHRVGARTRRRATLADVVALVEGGADYRVPARALPRLAGVSARAETHVVAGGAVLLRGVGTGAARRVTVAHGVALVEGRADHRVPARALPRLASVGSGTEAPIVAGGAVLSRRVGADSCGRVALAHRVALIESRADDRVRPDALACRAAVGLGTGIAIIAGRPVVLGEVDAGTSGRTGLPRAGGLGAATLSLQGESAVDAARVARLVTLLAARGLDDAIATAGRR